MRNLAAFWCPPVFALAACSSNAGGATPPRHPQQRGSVRITFNVPVPPAHSADAARRPQYFSPSTTTIAIALKSVDNVAVSQGTGGNIFDLNKICQQSGAFFYCSTTVTLLSGDDVVGVLAYASQALGNLKAPVPLSFGEGEVMVGSGSSAEPAGAEDTTGRLSVTLAPVIYGGQVQTGSSARAESIPITLTTLVDAGVNAIPSNAYQTTPPFANTPYLSDSDASSTSLKDLTTGSSGQSVALSSSGDSIELVNGAHEKQGHPVIARITFTAAQPDATFTVPAYFQLTGSIASQYTVPPQGSTSYLTFACTAAGCRQQ